MTTITTGSRTALLVDSSDDIDLVVYYQDDSGVAVDLTGFDIEWVFEIHGVTLTATVGDGLTLVEEEGKISLHFEAGALDETLDPPAPLPQGLGKHRLQITNPVDKTLTRGPLTNDT